MALTEQQYKDLIILQVGDNAAGLLAANIDLLWTAHADVASDPLHALLVKVDAIDLMLGEARKYTSFKALDGASVSASDLFDHLMAMREATLAQINLFQEAASAGGAAGQLTTTAPIGPPTVWGPDANDRAYRGDAYRSRKRRGEL